MKRDFDINNSNTKPKLGFIPIINEDAGFNVQLGRLIKAQGEGND